MGLIIFPVLLFALVAAITAFIIFVKKIVRKTLSISEVLFDVVIAIVIFGILFLDYMSSEEVYALSAAILFPFFMVIVPYSIYVGIKPIQHKKVTFICNALLVTTILSALIISLFPDYTLNIAEHFSLNKYY
jgi:cytochrome bd-type quinol oxidase subunit 2